jgi:hypothetical protein
MSRRDKIWNAIQDRSTIARNATIPAADNIILLVVSNSLVNQLDKTDRPRITSGNNTVPCATLTPVRLQKKLNFRVRHSIFAERIDKTTDEGPNIYPIAVNVRQDAPMPHDNPVNAVTCPVPLESCMFG